MLQGTVAALKQQWNSTMTHRSSGYATNKLKRMGKKDWKIGKCVSRWLLMHESRRKDERRHRIVIVTKNLLTVS